MNLKCICTYIHSSSPLLLLLRLLVALLTEGSQTALNSIFGGTISGVVTRVLIASFLIGASELGRLADLAPSFDVPVVLRHGIHLEEFMSFRNGR